MNQPKPFDIFESDDGTQFVLIKLAVNGIWLALQLKPLNFCHLSEHLNLKKLHYIGRVTFP